jgi:hypothetical protein
VRAFQDGYWVVYGHKDTAGNGLGWGAVSGDGRLAIPCSFAFLESFNEGMAPASDDGHLLGYIHPNGRYAILPQFEDARAFSDGKAAVRMGDAWGYIRPNGRLHILPQFAQAGDFCQAHFAPVKLKSGEWGIIGTEGQYLARPQFDNAAEAYHNTLLFRYRGKWGGARATGTVCINPEFDQLGARLSDYTLVYAAGQAHSAVASVVLAGVAEGQWGSLKAGQPLGEVLGAIRQPDDLANAQVERTALYAAQVDTLRPFSLLVSSELQFTAPPVINRPKFEGALENGAFVRKFVGYERGWNYSARLRAASKWIDCSATPHLADSLAHRIGLMLQANHGARLVQSEEGAQLYQTPRMRFWVLRAGHRVGIRIEFADLDEAEPTQGLRS